MGLVGRSAFHILMLSSLLAGKVCRPFTVQTWHRGAAGTRQPGTGKGVAGTTWPPRMVARTPKMPKTVELRPKLQPRVHQRRCHHLLLVETVQTWPKMCKAVELRPKLQPHVPAKGVPPPVACGNGSDMALWGSWDQAAWGGWRGGWGGWGIRKATTTPPARASGDGSGASKDGGRDGGQDGGHARDQAGAQDEQGSAQAGGLGSTVAISLEERVRTLEQQVAKLELLLAEALRILRDRLANPSQDVHHLSLTDHNTALVAEAGCALAIAGLLKEIPEATLGAL